jgi:hypothetical protein
MRVLDLVVRKAEHPADKSRHSHRREIAPGHQFDVHGLGRQMTFHCPVHQVEHAGGRRNVRENFVALLHFAEKRVGIKLVVRERVADAVVQAASKNHQLLGVLDRQRAQHQRVDQAENRGVRPDSERKRKQRNQRDPGAAQHRA